MKHLLACLSFTALAAAAQPVVEVSTVRDPELKSYATMARGLTFRNAGEGAQITVVEAGSAAAAAGVQAGDVVVSAGGASVSDMTALAMALQAAAGAAELTVMRDGERITLHLPG